MVSPVLDPMSLAIAVGSVDRVRERFLVALEFAGHHAALPTVEPNLDRTKATITGSLPARGNVAAPLPTPSTPSTTMAFEGLTKATGEPLSTKDEPMMPV